LQADVNVKLVANLRNKVKAKVLPAIQAAQHVSGTGITNKEKQMLQKVRL
jgi:signal recognition particle GTPase